MPPPTIPPHGKFRTPYQQLRFLQTLNNSSSLTIPAFGLVRVVSADAAGVLTVDRPNADGMAVMVNSLQPVQPSNHGAATNQVPTYALYETGDGTPAVGETWGAGSGSYKLRKNKAGFTIVGGPANGLVMVDKATTTATTGALPGVLLVPSGGQTFTDQTGVGAFTNVLWDVTFQSGATFFGANGTATITLGAIGWYSFGLWLLFNSASFAVTYVVSNLEGSAQTLALNSQYFNLGALTRPGPYCPLAGRFYVSVAGTALARIMQFSGGGASMTLTDGRLWLSYDGTLA